MQCPMAILRFGILNIVGSTMNALPGVRSILNAIQYKPVLLHRPVRLILLFQTCWVPFQFYSSLLFILQWRIFLKENDI